MVQKRLQRFGAAPPAGIDPDLGQSPPRGLDVESEELLEAALPRGLPFGRQRQNRSERAQWAGVEEIGEPAHQIAAAIAACAASLMEDSRAG